MDTHSTVSVIVLYGNKNYMQKISDPNVLPENLPAIARVLMDNIYTRLDDQVDAAKLQAHRRRLRAKHREAAVGLILTPQSKEAGK